MSIPTMNKMMKVYLESAVVERIKCGRPDERTVRNTRAGLKMFLGWLNERRESLGYARMGMDEDFPLVSIVKPALVHSYLAEMLKKGIKPVTALSYVNQLRQLFAKWVRPYYEDHDWKVPAFPFVGGRSKTPRYVRPTKERLASLKKWYAGLSRSRTMYPARRRLVSSGELWFVSTMMLEFAMRNGDIARLGPENFVEQNGHVYLNYIPHKTANSSGRVVRWPIHPDILARLHPLPERLPELDADVFDALNRQMRQLGFTGSKGAYELRKICIDHVYQKFGAEMAVSISGDDIRTIMRYYADPSQPNIGDVRVVDLL